MNKIEILEAKAFISIELKVKHSINCRIIISVLDDPLSFGFIIEKNAVNTAMIKNQQFILKCSNEKFTTKEKELVNEGFYEIIRQLKNHPSYRLKIIHMINEDIRTIWNNI